MKTIINLYKDYIDSVEPKLVPLAIRKLTQAILSLAIKDIKNENEYRDNAVRWIFCNNTNYIFSFLNICQVLELNPECVRKAIKSKLPKNYQTIPPALEQIIKGYRRCRN